MGRLVVFCLIRSAAVRFAGAAAAALCIIAWASPARASIPTCTTAYARAAAPAGVAVGDIPNLTPALPATSGGVADIAAGFFGPGTPETCLVTGSVVTNPSTGKTANFGALLPARASWNGKFMFEGCGGNCGSVSVLPTAAVLGRGYPVWATDDGHLASNPAWPILAPGVPNPDTIVDFAYRAVHTVVADGKQFTLRYFSARTFERAYYEGCSDGGREGMVEANRYPDDFDGVLAGDPYFDVAGQTIIVSNVSVQFRLRDARISPAQLALASKIVLAQCDAVDGVRDGLIQNPALCRFNPQTDLPRCRTIRPGPDCFTPAQAESLSTILAAMTDPSGTAVHPGFPVSDMNEGPGANLAAWTAISTPPSNITGPQPWPNGGAPFDWVINDPGMHYWAYLGQPGYNSLATPGFAFRRGGPGPIDVFHTVSPHPTVDRVYGELSIASADFPRELERFIAKNHKLILYHGYSDGFITPYTTMQYYRELAALSGGYDRLTQNVRLFMVPGMYHCSGGPGPANFGQSGTQPRLFDASHDATAALERWVESGKAPEHFIATKFLNDDPTRAVLRTMPLCTFPRQTRYRGGNVDDAQSWTCPRADASQLAIGFDGFEAGLGQRLYQHGRH